MLAGGGKKTTKTPRIPFLLCAQADCADFPDSLHIVGKSRWHRHTADPPPLSLLVEDPADLVGCISVLEQ